MNFIINFFEKQLKICKENKFSRQDDLDLLSNFYNKYDLKYNTINNILDLNYSDIMIILLYLKNNMPIKEAIKKVEPIKELLNSIDFSDDNSHEFMSIIKIIYCGGTLLVKEKYKRNPLFQNEQFLEFIDDVESLQVFDYLTTFGCIKTTYQELYDLSSPKDRSEIQKIIIPRLNQVNSFNEFYNGLYGCLKKEISSLWKLKMSEEEQNSKMCVFYEDILSEIQKKEIINYNKSFFQIDENLQKELMIAIMIHNEKVYNNLSQEYLEMKNHPDYLKKLFLSNGYDMTKLSEQDIINLLSYGDLNKISKILPIIKEKPFSINETNKSIVKVLLYSDESILNKLKDYCTKNILNEEFLCSFPDVLISDKYKSCIRLYYSYETLISNISYLLSKNFNVMNIRKTNPNILILDNNDLKKYITRLEKYNINFQNQKNNDYRYLSLSQTLVIIDRFIELGLSEYIKDNIEELIPNGNLIIKRIHIAKKIGLNIFDENNKLNSSITRGYNFPVGNKDLDNLILNETNNKIDKEIIYSFNNTSFKITPIINFLDSKFLYDENYLFDDIIISRNKVIRNLSSIDLDFNNENICHILLNAIIYNSILDADEINIISEKISKLVERNKTKIKN